MIEEKEYLADEELLDERPPRRKKKHRSSGAVVVFAGGVIIGVCVMLIVMRLNKGRYDAQVISEAMGDVIGGEKQLTQEDIEAIREKTEIDSQELERLLSNYDEDSLRGADKDTGDVTDVTVDDVSPEMVYIDGTEVPTEPVYSDEPADEIPPGAETPAEVAAGIEAAGDAGTGADINAVDEGEDGDDVGAGGTAAPAKPAESKAESGEDAASLIETLKFDLMSGLGTTPSLRKLFRDQIMVTSGGRFFFFPISDELEHHDLEGDRFTVNDDGTMDYTFEDGRRAKRGVDVSKYQGAIDWEKVAAAGIDFAIIRAGYRGYGSGELVMDETFMANALGASAQGIEIGVYFFSQAVNEEEAREEARVVIDALEGQSIAYPIVFDQEKVKGGRINSMSMQQYTDVTLAFCNEVAAAGYEPMIYGNLESFFIMLDMKRLEGISKWFAYYNTDLYFPYRHDIWQYSSTGRVDGIVGDVDMNISFR